MTELPGIPGSTISLAVAGQRTQAAARGKADETQGGGDRQTLQEACTEFESLFLYQLLKEMRATIPDDGYLGKSMQSETYTSLFDIEIARRLSAQKGIGLADFLMQQMANRLSENSREEIAD